MFDYQVCNVCTQLDHVFFSHVQNYKGEKNRSVLDLFYLFIYLCIVLKFSGLLLIPAVAARCVYFAREGSLIFAAQEGHIQELASGEMVDGPSIVEYP